MPSAVRPLLFIMLTGLCAVAGAAVPGNVSYQGFLTAPSGQTIDADTSITFSIYAVEVDGSPLWFETLLVPVDNGLFSVTLGNPANPFPPGLFETPLYLGIRVEGDVEMTPRRPLTSVGFSFKAEDADALQGRSATDLDQAAAVAALQANTVLQLDTVLSIGGGGEAELRASGGLLAANTIAGNDQPDLIVGGLADTSDGDNGIIASEPSLAGSDLLFHSNDAFVFDLDNDNSGQDTFFLVRGGDDSELMNIDQDGQVRLHGATSLTAGDDPINGPVLSFIGETSDQAESGRIRFFESSNPANNLRGGYLHYDGSANKMHIGVHDSGDTDPANDEDIITIERSSGQVGIGTTSPDRELTVNDTDGSGGASINVTAPNRELLMAVNQSSGGIVGTLTDTDLQFRTNNSNRMIIDNAGDVEVRNDLEIVGDVSKRYSGVPASIAPFAMAKVTDDALVHSTANIVNLQIVSQKYRLDTDVFCETTPSNPSYTTTDLIGFVNVLGPHESASVEQRCSESVGGRFVLVEIRDTLGLPIREDFELIVFKPFCDPQTGPCN